jgi:hypothetical protein
MKIEITKDQYFIIKALFNAVSDDSSRQSLQNVFWDHQTKNVVACDGHILRVEPMKFPFTESVQFEAKSFLLTFKQVKTLYPSNHSLIEVDYTPDLDKEISSYPNYKNVLAKVESEADLTSLNMISFGFEVLAKFHSSFVSKPKNLTMAFTGQKKAVWVYKEETFVGVIMPFNIMKSPLPEALEASEDQKAAA